MSPILISIKAGRSILGDKEAKFGVAAMSIVHLLLWPLMLSLSTLAFLILVWTVNDHERKRAPVRARPVRTVRRLR